MLERAKAFLREHPEATIIASSRYAADDLVRIACQSALIGVERYSIRDLVYALSSDRMNAMGLIPVSRIVREALAAGVAREARLSYLRDVADFPGFPRALARTLEELRLAGVPKEQLAHCGRSGSDLALLLELYESELRRRRFADYPVRVQLAREQADSMSPPAMILLDVDVRTAAERDLVSALTTRSQNSLSLQPEGTGNVRVSLLSASSEALESVEIARNILETGVPFDQCGILLRNPQRHIATVREALGRAGIPTWLAEGVRKPDLAGRALVTLLRCRQEDLSAARFAEYLSLEQVPREEGESVFGWERRLRDAAVVRGLVRWESRLEGALQRELVEYEKAADERERIARRIGQIEALQGFALPVVRRLAALPEQATWRDWIESLGSLAPLVLKNPRSVEELLDQLRPLADFGPVTLAQVVLTLERNLLTWQDEENDTRYGRVFVGSIEDARGMSFRKVCVPGLNEGLFPRPVREDPLLLDEQRLALGMPVSRDDIELLNIVASCTSESALFTYARLDLATGRERVKSFFAFEVASEGEKEADSETRVGWSAPYDPLRAIDATEFDLATIREARGTPGGCAWVLAGNPHVARSIRVRQERWSRDWTDSDGMGGEDIHAAQLLAAYRPNQRAYPPSSLEQFARCPYRFFLKAIQGLKAVEEPEMPERMDPRLRGDIYHRVQSQLMRSPASLDESLADLDHVLERIAAEYDPVVPDVWQAGVESLRADLRGWLHFRWHYERQWTVVEAEHKFEQTLAEGWKLKGTIDAIEQGEDRTVRITDYKTGRAPRESVEYIGAGESLQPVLYALAAESMGHEVVEARLAYATLRSNYRIDRIPLDSRARMNAQVVLGTMDRWIDKGFLPAAPRAEGCIRCEYVPVCGPYEELRARQKSQPELRDLIRIREMP